MIKYLDIDTEEFIKLYGKTNKAMTASIISYLKLVYPEKADEYKLIYRKA